jgi:hypothetical protein
MFVPFAAQVAERERLGLCAGRGRRRHRVDAAGVADDDVRPAGVVAQPDAEQRHVAAVGERVCVRLEAAVGP